MRTGFATFVLALAAITCVLVGPAADRATGFETYRAYAEGLLARPPAGVRVRADLEKLLDGLASSARRKAGRRGVKASGLLRKAARAQAIDLLRTGRVGHRSKRGDRFSVRFEAFAGEEHGTHGENALRSAKRAGTASGQARHMMKVWLGSAGHRRNLMGRDYRYVSTGVVQKGSTFYAVQMFWEK